jgi:threonine dehydrogenase-like Zn-dependent dehydrogenase
MYAAGDVRVEDRPDPRIVNATDAVVRVVAAGICGSDLHPYHSMPRSEQGRPMGHEFVGVVEDIGGDVSGLKPGDLALSPFTFADNTCEFCREGLHTSCPQGGRYVSTGSTAAKARRYGCPKRKEP